MNKPNDENPAHWTDGAMLEEALANDDARDLLDRSISGLRTRDIDPRLMDWLAIRLERLMCGEASKKVFNLSRPANAPKGIHGSGRFTGEQVAAATELARRRFSKKGDAHKAVAKAVGWTDPSTAQKRWKHYSESLIQHDEQTLTAMCRDDLVKRIRWP